MGPLKQQRRSFLVTLAGLGVGPLLPRVVAAGQPAAHQGDVLGPAAGEHLVHFRDGGDIFIKLGTATRSAKFRLLDVLAIIGGSRGTAFQRHGSAERERRREARAARQSIRDSNVMRSSLFAVLAGRKHRQSASATLGHATLGRVRLEETNRSAR